jgi:hypothetical protein
MGKIVASFSGKREHSFQKIGRARESGKDCKKLLSP